MDKSSSACFGCCLNYPPPGGCSTESCKSDNLIAIACGETLIQNIYSNYNKEQLTMTDAFSCSV